VATLSDLDVFARVAFYINLLKTSNIFPQYYLKIGGPWRNDSVEKCVNCPTLKSLKQTNKLIIVQHRKGSACFHRRKYSLFCTVAKEGSEIVRTSTIVLWIRNCSAYSQPMTSHALGWIADSRRTLAAESGGRTSWPPC